MSKRTMDRREFLKRAAGAAAVAAAWPRLPPAASGPVAPALRRQGASDPGLRQDGRPRAPHRHRPGLALLRRPPDKAQAILQACLDNGFYHLGTPLRATGPRISSARSGSAACWKRGARRFLATKCEARTYDETLKEFEGSLKRLRTDFVDLYQIHLLQSAADVEVIASERGALKALRRLERTRKRSGSSASPATSRPRP